MNEPSIGAFFFDCDEGRLYSRKLSVDAAIRSEGFRGSSHIYLPLSSSKVWDALRRENPKWEKLCGYDEIPRGRVYWNKATLGFEVCLSPSLRGKEDAIRKEFDIRDHDLCEFEFSRKELFTQKDREKVLKFHREFPTYPLRDMPDAIVEAVLEGWIEDVSWHNDAMPCFEAHGLRLWTDFKESELREYREGKRFSVSRVEDESNVSLVAFEEEGKVPSALELMRFAGVNVKTLLPVDLIRRLARIVGFGFNFSTPVEEYGLGWGQEMQETLDEAVKLLGEKEAYEVAMEVWREDLMRDP